MESVVLIAPRSYDEEIRVRLGGEPGCLVQGAIQWTVEGAGARVYISRNDHVREELSVDELAEIYSVFEHPVFYTVDFSDIRLCRKVLEALVDDPQLLVDNDHGVRLPGPAFLQLLRSQPDWDWRLDRT